MNVANGQTIRFWTRRKIEINFYRKIFAIGERFMMHFFFNLSFSLCCEMDCVIAAPQCWRLMGQFESSIFEWDEIVTDDEQVLCNSHVSTAASMQNTSATGTTNACGIHNQCKNVCFCSMPRSNAVMIDAIYLFQFETLFQFSVCLDAEKETTETICCGLTQLISTKNEWMRKRIEMKQQSSKCRAYSQQRARFSNSLFVFYNTWNSTSLQGKWIKFGSLYYVVSFFSQFHFRILFNPNPFAVYIWSRYVSFSDDWFVYVWKKEGEKKFKIKNPEQIHAIHLSLSCSCAFCGQIILGTQYTVYK